MQPMKTEEGTIEVLYNNQKQNPLFNKPVLQVITLQKIGTSTGEKFRYRANLSDGIFYMRAVFSSELSHHFEKENIDKYSLIKIGQWVLRTLKESNFMYIQGIDTFEKCNVQIGNPVNYETGKASLNNSARNQVINEESIKRTSFDEGVRKTSLEEGVKKSKISVNNNSIINEDVENNSNNEVVTKSRAPLDDNLFTQINAINPFHNNLFIKGRIIIKNEIKKFNNKRGEGKLFSFEIADTTGQIKVVAFSESVDIFYPIIEVGRVYTIHKAHVKMSNKQYSVNNSDYEIHLDANSEINLLDDENAPKFFFNFVKFNDMVVGPAPVDVIGVVKDAGVPSSFIVKSTQKESTRRDITLVDETGSIRATLWGSKATEDVEVDSVLAIKSIKVSEYSGISLSSIHTSQLYKNPDIPESHALLGWYNEEGKNIKIELPERESKISTIGEVKDQEMPFSSVRATLMTCKEDSLMYDACKEENCTKKVFKNEFGEYRCEKCDKTSYECDHRYIVHVNISDNTGQLWAVFFNEQALLLFGLTATEFREMAENDANQSQMFIKKFLYKDYIFKIRSKQDTYNDEVRTRHTISDIRPVSFVEETKRNLVSIEKFLKEKN